MQHIEGGVGTHRAQESELDTAHHWNYSRRLHSTRALSLQQSHADVVVVY